MRIWPSLLLLLISTSVTAQAIQPGRWDVRSTAVDLVIPGAPGFLRIADGRYAQTLTCAQKSGPPIQIKRAGTYDTSGFAGRLEMAGQTPKGPMSIILDQKAVRADASCGG